MAILDVRNSSNNPWVGCPVTINNTIDLKVPQSGEINLTRYGQKVSIRANGVVLRFNNSIVFLLGLEEIITANYCIQIGSERIITAKYCAQKGSFEVSQTVVAILKGQNNPLLRVG